MAAFDYSRPRATAERMIARYGQSAAIRRTTRSGPEFDPITTFADFACKAVALEYSNREIDGTRIRAGDAKVFISTAGLTIAPSESDALVIGGVTHEIVVVKPLSPAGVVVFYEVQARR